jgi:ATP-dependent RNA helicase DDX35
MLKKFAPNDTPFSSCGDDTIPIKKCLISGYFGNAAKLSNTGGYMTVRGRNEVTAHPLSVIARYHN